ncbi:hypothetical protein Glove_248g61 [Diversispora epigaea]|uniref:Uncharacterized protein n=1 Tax=Diversispora epigaea TaxID=1348612 RepID=A0A397IAB4_9GLOM|nr:hypothetical protein Glove_248g61 [Diversispora epigaea]
MKRISNEYYRAGSTYLSEEAIKEIKSFSGKGPNIIYAMAKKYYQNMGRIHKEYYSASARYLSNEAIREIKGSMGSVPNAINTMAKKYRINYYRVLDYIENRERKQQIIQSTVSNQIESEVLLQSRPLSDELEIQGSAPSLNHTSSNLHLESSTSPNTEIKKRSSKSRSKSVHISDPIPSSSSILVNNGNPTEKISVGSRNVNDPIDINDQIEREIKRKDKNLANSARIQST